MDNTIVTGNLLTDLLYRVLDPRIERVALVVPADRFALAVKLEDGGPVFFRQQRVGRHGHRFHMLKFRTMVPNAEALKDSLRHRNEAMEGLFKIAEDPRVTRVGRLLRRSALDELPQMWNIVRGEMSLVGPRPLVIDEDRHVEGCLPEGAPGDRLVQARPQLRMRGKDAVHPRRVVGLDRLEECMGGILQGVPALDGRLQLGYLRASRRLTTAPVATWRASGSRWPSPPTKRSTSSARSAGE